MRYFLVCISLMLVVNASITYGQDSADIETMKGVSIIGNSELPSTVFDLPWRLPSVDKREDQSPVKDVPGLVRYIEPYRYKQQIHFSKYLEVDTTHFIAR